ncbi:HlyD family secretion protein [Jeongeupia naejangsanensis]|uniref:HlyD family secretion protein n=1 Tax=Jeongeupia naejangsanensis TaxID=613195 RepID=UPI0027E569FA|nr:HlyD family efflux transporter periplasmic adaptor subunit [Jeongeupia naejangsanensis]
MPDVFQGYVEGEFVQLAASQSGRLDRLMVQRGQQLARDAALFALDAVDEKAAQQQAQRLLDAAAAQLADLQTGKRPQEINVTRAQLDQAAAQARKSRLQMGRDEAQFRSGFVSQARLDESRAQAEADAARVLELQRQLDVARLPGRDEQIRAQSAQVGAARAALAQADWQLEQKSVRAPAAGLVFDTMYREGEWVLAGSPVVRMLPPGNIKVRFFVPESRLGAVRVGQHVQLTCDGCAKPVTATVSYISPRAEYTPPVIFSNETRAKLVFMIEALPDQAVAAALHPGQPVTVAVR